VIKYAFDLYPRANPVSGSRIVRFSKLQEAWYRGEANGTGSGRIMLRGTSADAGYLDPKGLQYIRVVRINTSVVDGATLSGFSEKVVGGFFLGKGDFEALTERSTKKLTFTGAGTLSYLDRAVAAEATYIAGSDGPFDDLWHWFYSTAGSILWRMVTEALDGDRPQAPIAGVTMTFTQWLDSDGNTWPGYGTSWLFTASVGESLLSICRRLMQAGLYVWMDPDTFELSAWLASAHGRDRTGGAWGTNVVRFQSPTDGTIATASIKSDAKRGISALIKRSDILIGANNVYQWVNDPSADLVWEGSYRENDPSGGSFADIAAAQLQARDDAGDTVRLRMFIANSPTTGKYLPFEHVLLDDLVTLHTGTGPWDWNEAAEKVAAITISLRSASGWDAWVDLGSTYSSIETRQFQVAGTGGGGCTCPTFAPECQPDLAGTEIVGDTDAGWPGEYPYAAAYCGGDVHRMGFSGGSSDPVADSPSTSYLLDLTIEASTHDYTARVKYYNGDPDSGGVFLSQDEFSLGNLGNEVCVERQIAFTTPATCTFITVNFASKLGGWKYRATISDTGTAISNSAYCLIDPGVSPHPMRSDDPRVLQLISQMSDLIETAGLTWKRPVRVATTAADTLASSFEAGDMLDGVTLVEGDRILIKDQATGAENGIYLVAASGAPTRAADFDQDEDISGAVAFVSEGTANSNKVFVCTTNEPIVLSTTTLVFAELSGGGGVSDHGALTGLADDDHPQYALDADLPTLDDYITNERLILLANRGDLKDDGNTGDSWPENTKEGFRQAMEKGLNGIEVDVGFSSDGTPHALHDDTLTRTTNLSGNISAASDATIAGGHIDAGFGYNSTRHGTTLKVPTVASIITACEIYQPLYMFELKSGTPTQMADFVVAQGIADRAIITVDSTADAATVHGVDSRIRTLMNKGSAGEGNANVDWLSWDYSDVDTLADVQAEAPQVPHAYIPIGEFASADETTILTNMFNRGVRSWETYGASNALAVRKGLMYGNAAYGTPALTLGTSNTAGSISEAIRRDATILVFDATAPETQAFGDVADTGSASTAARRDHLHGMPSGGGGGLPLTSVINGVPELVWDENNSLIGT
jgi:hypothetical protein